MAANTPWKDRKELLKEISSFTFRNGGFFKQNSKRMSDLFEMSVYNDVVKFYRRHKYSIEIINLQSDKTFNYKLSPAGLSKNFSYYLAKKENKNGVLKDCIEIHHNIKIQSRHDNHMYYTADVSVCSKNGVKTDNLKRKNSHSYIANNSLITFFEVKNMNPFPEIIYNFSGVVLEIMPEFIINNTNIKICKKDKHLTPSIIFSGSGGQHVEYISNNISERYGHNIISGLFINKGRIYSFDTLNTYDGDRKLLLNQDIVLQENPELNGDNADDFPF